MNEIYIAQAAISETGGIWGRPGDQMQKAEYDGEVNVIPWYGWFIKGFRWKDKDKAKKAAELAVRIAANKRVGYSQNNGASPRTSLADELQAAGGDPYKIKKDCNCDCASYCMAVLAALGVKVSRDMWTGTAVEELRKTGAFEEYTVTGQEDVKDGDILWVRDDQHAHMGIGVEWPRSGFKATHEATASTYVRENPGKTAKICRTDAGAEIVLAAGDKLMRRADESLWLPVELPDGTRGWVSSKYTKEL